jgi:hypothetical protein
MGRNEERFDPRPDRGERGQLNRAADRVPLLQDPQRAKARDGTFEIFRTIRILVPEQGISQVELQPSPQLSLGSLVDKRQRPFTQSAPARHVGGRSGGAQFLPLPQQLAGCAIAIF